MPTFNNLKDLEKWLASEKGQTLVMNDNTIKRELIKEAKRLQGYLREELQSYFNSYDAAETYHRRTGDTIRSVKVGAPKKTELGFWSIEVYWDDNLAYHNSVLGGEKGHTGFLLNYGWDIRDKMPYEIPNFTHFEGVYYIEKAIERWNKENKLGMKITIRSKWG